MRAKRIMQMVIVLAAIATLSSCSSGSDADSTGIDGTWSGTIAATLSGTSMTMTFTTVLSQDGSTGVDGSLTAAAMDGDAFPGTLPVSVTGTISGSTMALPIVMSFTESGTTYEYDVTLSGTVSGSTYSGTATVEYLEDSVSQWSVSGTFTATKS